MAKPTLPPRVRTLITRAEATPMKRGGVDSWTTDMRRMSGAVNPMPATPLLERGGHAGWTSVFCSVQRVNKGEATHKAVAIAVFWPDMARPMVATPKQTKPAHRGHLRSLVRVTSA